MMDISIPYYEDMSRISNSNIGWFIKSGPSFLHKKLTGQIPDEKGPQLERGTMIHEYILQPEEFDKDYYVYDGTKPSSANQELFCELLANSTEIEPDKQLLEAYKKSYSIVGKSEDKMLSEAKKIASTLKNYIEAWKTEKIIINSKDVEKCAKVKANIDEHKFASTLLNNKDWEEHHEFHINWEYCNVKCKSLLDCVQFDFINKHCNLIDLKTTVNINNFQDSMNHYDYLRQLCFYTLALQWYLDNERGQDPSEWTFDWYIVAIDSTKESSVRVFKFTEEQVFGRDDTISDALNNIRWHFENNLWEHSRAYYKGEGYETLDL